MRKTETFHIVLELIAILSNIVIGVTVLTFIIQDVAASKLYIGAIVLAVGATQMIQFLSLKDLARRRNIVSALVAGSSMVFGLTLMFLPVDIKLTCILWGAFSIAFQVGKIFNSAFTLLRQPFHNGIMIILCIIEIIFDIFLIVKAPSFVYAHLIFIGVSLLIEAFVLVVEFTIHRYQK